MRNRVIRLILITVLISGAVMSEPRTRVGAATTWYDMRTLTLTGTNPVGNQCQISLTSAQVAAGTGVHVTGSIYQSGTVDTSLQVQVLMNGVHYVWGPNTIEQTTSFAVDIISYQGSSSTSYKLTGSGLSGTYPNPPTPHGIIDGNENSININNPITFEIQVLGTAQASSGVTSNGLSAKVL